MNTIDLDGAIINYNDDRTWAKGFVGTGEAMRVKGYSTAERWQPDALTLAMRWVAAQGIVVLQLESEAKDG